MLGKWKHVLATRAVAKKGSIRSIILAQCCLSVLGGVAYAAPYVGNGGPNTLIGTTENDTFRGLGGKDRLIGDFFSDSPGFPDLNVPCRAGAGVEGQPINGGNSIVAGLENDLFDDGPGDDTVIGDALAIEFGEFQLFALSGAGALGGGDGGDFNAARCFSDSNAFRFGEDSFVGGLGNDTFVGDAFYSNTHPENLNMDAGAGSAGMGRYSFFPYGAGGNGGDNNTLQAFDDVIDFRQSFGMKTLIGDAYAKTTSGSEDHLIASAGSGSASNFSAGGDGGNSNTVSAFNDILRAAPQTSKIVGDDLREGGAGGETRLVASAGAAGENAGGAGGVGNSVRAFSDLISGDFGADLLVGDALNDQGTTADLKLVVYSGFSPPGGGVGGSGNSVSAFNDSIDGDFSADVIIGDAWNKGANDGVRFVVGVGAGNSARAFSDTLSGGAGNDQIYGDARFDSAVCRIDELQLNIANPGQVALFQDTISGGTGDDRIHGGFGADRMDGGPGRDTFVYYAPDLADLGSGVPIDIITGFSVLPAGDVLDMRPLLTCLGFDPGDDPNQWLGVAGVNLQVDRDGPGGAFGFVTIATGVTGTINSLRSTGHLLVP